MALVTSIKALAQVQLGVGIGAIYTAPTVPPNAQTVIRNMWICNTDTVGHRITLRYSGATVINSLLEQALLPGNTTWYFDENFILTMSAGNVLEGAADIASKITVTVNGEEIL